MQWSLRCTRWSRPVAIVATLLLAVLIAAIAELAYARARRRPKADAGGSIAELAQDLEAERCDFVFAIAALEDPSSLRLLERALDDPCEAVALAAAHALATSGSTMPERFLPRTPAGAPIGSRRALGLLA